MPTMTKPSYGRSPPAPNATYDLSVLDIAENLWLWRHRQQSRHGAAPGRRGGAMSQSEAAEFLSLTHQQYGNLERGDATLLTAAELGRLYRHRRCWTGLVPTEAELCFLARRRSRLMVKDAAARMGVSVTFFTKAEEAGDPDLKSFWIRQGFRFPGAPRLVRPGSQPQANL